MNRRRFLELGAGLTLAASLRSQPHAAGQRVVIAGAGIIGASIAYHLAARGAAVTVLEKGQPAGGATEKSFAWINASFTKRVRSYFLLNHLGVEAWQQLERELGGELKVQWNGSLEWYADAQRAARVRNSVRQHQQWGYATRLIGEAELRRLEKNVVPGPIDAGVFSAIEGHVDPVQATDLLLQHARRLDARVETSCEVTGLDIRDGRLRAVRCAKAEFEADVLVVACGVDTPRVAAMAGLVVPLKDSPGVLVHTVPRRRLIERVVHAPRAHMKQKHDGRFVVGENFGGTPSTDTSLEEAGRLMEEAVRFVPGLAGIDIEKVTLGWRPFPRDGYPIVGFTRKAPNVYLTVMHSGVTLAPLIGRLAALEILDRLSLEILDPYRLSRFS